jgi:hypothetical protein
MCIFNIVRGKPGETALLVSLFTHYRECSAPSKFCSWQGAVNQFKKQSTKLITNNDFIGEIDLVAEHLEVKPSYL